MQGSSSEDGSPAIILPNQSDDMWRFAIDIGGSLIKIVYFSSNKSSYSSSSKPCLPSLGGGRLQFVKFETRKMDDCIEFVRSKKLHCFGECAFKDSGMEETLIKVVLVANSLPALNDVTAVELPEIIAKAAKHCNILREAAKAGGLPVSVDCTYQKADNEPSSNFPRLMVVENSCGSPCIDFRQVSSQLASVAKTADLVILEGMGRALHTNYNAHFTCEALKLAMVKNQRLAEKIVNGNIYDCICQYEAANP